MTERLSAPYFPHPFFTEPANGAARIWRFMDSSKYESLLENGALYFSRSDRVSDPWEGAFPTNNVRNRSAATLASPDGPSVEELSGLSAFHRSLRLHTFLSCWHLNDRESAGMWQQYTSRNAGVAVQSTFDRLISSFQGDENDMFEVYVGTIRYLDYDLEQLMDGNTFIPFLHKRRAYEHEQELRAVIQRVFPDDVPLADSEPSPDGLFVEVDLTTLIENIFVAPTSSDSFTDWVESVADRYSIHAPVRSSDLAKPPQF
jgi:hypothetical protein